MLQAKVSLGFRDTWAHYANGGKIGNRQALQVAARDYIADSNCRTCHQDLLLNAAGTGPVSDKGRREHTIYLKNNPHPDKGSCSRCHGRNSAKKMRNTEIKGCVSCHEQLAHKRSMLQKTADKTRETAGKAYDATRSFLTE